MPVITFAPLRKSREVKPGMTVLAAANQGEVPIGQSCNGDGICGWCKVRIVEGADNLLPPSALEQRLMRSAGFAPDERAACLAKLKGDVTISTTYW